jgi:hypothetical protein
METKAQQYDTGVLQRQRKHPIQRLGEAGLIRLCVWVAWQLAA